MYQFTYVSYVGPVLLTKNVVRDMFNNGYSECQCMKLLKFKLDSIQYKICISIKIITHLNSYISV